MKDSGHNPLAGFGVALLTVLLVAVVIVGGYGVYRLFELARQTPPLLWGMWGALLLGGGVILGMLDDILDPVGGMIGRMGRKASVSMTPDEAEQLARIRKLNAEAGAKERAGLPPAGPVWVDDPSPWPAAENGHSNGEYGG